MNIAFKEDEKSLTVGKIEPKSGFAIFISCRTLDTPNLLNIILPVIKKNKTAFRLIKNQSLQYRLNSGDFGEEEAGKTVAIFPCAIAEAVQLATELNEITGHFKGPIIINAQRVGQVIFIQATEKLDNQIRLSMPNLKNFPFPIPKQYLLKQKRNAILGKYYLPVQALRSSPKGNIYKGINLKKFAFNWCLIKQGNPVALDDHFDRDMRDRLLWQKSVIEQIGNEVYTPHVLDYFEKNESSYLVLNYAEGELFGETVKGILNGLEWKSLCGNLQEQLLNWYLKILKLVETIHQKGFVHRDLTDTNFLVMNDGSLCVIDFELAYSLKEQKPNPPFLLGTFGYAAPEQLQYAVPDPKEDVYSLGALLCFVITGTAPHQFLTGNLQSTKAKLFRLSGDRHLTGFVIECLQEQRKHRPTLAGLKENLTNYLKNFKSEQHEKIAMAV